MPEGEAEVRTRRNEEALGVRAVGFCLLARPGCQVREHGRLYCPTEYKSGTVESVGEGERGEAQADG
jgi:hypothetical protein